MNAAQRAATVSGSFGECRNGTTQHLAVYFRPFDAGRSVSKRPKQQNDCTVRALAITCELAYDDAYSLLFDAGRVCSCGFQFSVWANIYPAPINGYRFKWRAFQAVKGEPRMNPAKFCATFSTGRWIVLTDKHVMAVIDGVVIDEHSPNPAGCIYGAWEVTRTTASGV